MFSSPFYVSKIQEPGTQVVQVNKWDPKLYYEIAYLCSWQPKKIEYNI